MTENEKFIKSYLESYAEIKHDIDEIYELLTMLYTTATGATHYYNGGTGGGPGDIVGNSVVMMDEAKCKIADRKLQAERRRKSITDLCKMVDKKTGEVLMLTYIDGMTRSDIAEAVGISVPSVSYYRTKGIRELASCCPKEQLDFLN